MSSSPKLVGRRVLITYYSTGFQILIQDPIQLAHFKPLVVAAIDIRPSRQGPGMIEERKINNGFLLRQDYLLPFAADRDGTLQPQPPPRGARRSTVSHLKAHSRRSRSLALALPRHFAPVQPPNANSLAPPGSCDPAAGRSIVRAQKHTTAADTVRDPTPVFGITARVSPALGPTDRHYREFKRIRESITPCPLVG